MGVVYEAFDEERQVRVALKMVEQLDAHALARFKNEFRSLADLDHPNLVRLDELFCEGGRWFFTMELIDGQRFLDWVRPNLLAESRLRAGLLQLARGLAALHASGKVHRDVKPSNVLVTKESRVVLLDFGLVTEISPHPNAQDSGVVGTALYMAPEQAAARGVTGAADWYAMGCVLYEALTGRTPFSGSPIDVLMDKQRYEPPPPRQLVPSVAPDLDALCVDLLRFDPMARPGDGQILTRLGANEVTRPATPEISHQTLTQVPSFVGREEELAALRAAFEDSRHGQAVTMMVFGESGLGKTALVKHSLDELAARESKLLVLCGRCYERECVPFKAFDGALDALSEHLTRMDPERVALLLPDDIDLLARLFPVLRRVPAVAQAPASASDVRDLHDVRMRAFGALRALLEQLATIRFLVLFIDDLQWADADSLALLNDLMRPPGAPPLFLVVTHRSIEPPNLHVGDRRDLSLGGLSREASATLARMLGGAEAAAIAEESGGHPLFIQELVRYASMTGEGSRRDLRLDEALLARIDRLEEPARRLLEIICTAGGPVRKRLAAESAGMTTAEAAKFVDLLRAAQFVRRQDENTIEPYHDRVRVAVASAISDDRRRAYHRALASTMEASGTASARALVRHLEAAGDLQRAAEQAEKGARAAGEALAFDQAAELYRVALRLGSWPPSERRRLQIAFATALVYAGRSADAADAFLDAAQGADVAVRLDCRRQAMEQFLISGHIERGLESLGSVLAEIGVKMPESRFDVLASLTWQRLKLRLRGLAWKPRDESEIPARELTRLEIFRGAAQGLALVDNARAADFGARATLLALRFGEPRRLLVNLATQVGHHACPGPSSRGRARKLVSAIEQIASEDGSPATQAWASTASGYFHYLMGEFGEARVDLSAAMQAIRTHLPGLPWLLSSTRLLFTFALRQSGCIRELTRRFNEYTRDAVRRGDRYLETTLSRSFNIVWLARDDVSGALRDLDAQTWAPTDCGFHLQHWYDLRARCEIDLYRGAPIDLERAHAGMSALEHSLNAHIQIVRADARWLRGRLAIAAGNLKLAGAMIRALEGERIAYARVWALLLRGGLAAAQAQTARACDHLRTAANLADEKSLRLCAAAARWQMSMLIDGDQALLGKAESWMASEGIRNPARMARLIVPIG